jgi:hypothetical protein
VDKDGAKRAYFGCYVNRHDGEDTRRMAGNEGCVEGQPNRRELSTELNGRELSVAQIAVLSSQRPDFTTGVIAQAVNCKRHRDKSWRSELTTNIYASDNSRPFSCFSISDQPRCQTDNSRPFCMQLSFLPVRRYCD